MAPPPVVPVELSPEVVEPVDAAAESEGVVPPAVLDDWSPLPLPQPIRHAERAMRALRVSLVLMGA